MLQALAQLFLWGEAEPPRVRTEPEPPRSIEPPADRLLERLRELGLRGISRCELTRNRRTMVSWRGATLRLHGGYVDAPDDIHRAIVRLVNGRTRAERRAASRIVLAHPVPVPDRPARREVSHPDDAPAVARLAAEHARLNAERFGGTLGTIPIRVSRRMRTRLGHYVAAGQAHGAEIAISRRHIRRHGWADAIETLLHEMVHQWQAESGLPLDHRAGFRRKAREVGIAPSATRRVD